MTNPSVDGEEVSLYFHLPFCRRKCPYCHFYVLPYREEHVQLLFEGFRLEWERVLASLSGKRIVTLYFGGGTPALVGPERIGELVQMVEGAPQEVTLEANPEDLSINEIERYRAVGINRLSLGVQSFDPDLLQLLGRGHTVERAIEVIEGSPIENLSIDLMFDLPGQTLASWHRTLKQAASLPITHISLYNLTIEPHTVFFKQRAELERQRPDPEVSTEMVRMAREQLSAEGLKQYEISAFGRPSLHNTGYWKGRPFLGLGPSAFSFWEGRRFRNVARLHKWVRELREGRWGVDFEERLEERAAEAEMAAIGIRLLEGIERERLGEGVTKRLREQGWIEEREGRVCLTEQGILFYDSVAEEIIF